jgi:hypothetical protein
MFRTEATVMVAGELKSEVLYEGDSANKASLVLEKFDRDQATRFVAIITGQAKALEPTKPEIIEDDDVPQMNAPEGGTEVEDIKEDAQDVASESTTSEPSSAEEDNSEEMEEE